MPPASAADTVCNRLGQEFSMRSLRLAFAWAFAPVFWFGFITAAIIWVARGGPLWGLAVLGLLAVGVSLAAERLLPYEQSWNRSHADRARDVVHAVVNESLNAAGIATWVVLVGLVQTEAARGLWPHSAPLWLQAIMALVLADLGITLAHLASHRYAPLWRLHAVHHSVTRMYGFNGLMKHPLHQMIEASAGMAPLLLLGISQQIAAVVALAVVVQLLLQHSNVDMRIGPLRHVFAFAPVHRFHHLRYGRSGDVNFGLFFSFWDRLLGTAFFVPTYRVSTPDLGIGQRLDYPKGYLAQLRAPFTEVATATAPPVLPPGLRELVRQSNGRSVRH
jgi:sterol desaturase/sphingolipid hydroxylase (fatty acid hydroxylase superfamily)